MLVLRTTPADFVTRNNFKWPAAGPVECTDWNSGNWCGNGLHGLPWGEGYCTQFGAYLNRGGVAQVIQVEDADVVLLEGGSKCKFRKGVVVFTGSLDDATAYMRTNGGSQKAIAHSRVIVGDNLTAAAGAHGRAIAGRGGIATTGDSGRAIGGKEAIAGDGGRVISDSNATVGSSGIAIAALYRGVASAGWRGMAVAGDSGSAKAGPEGSAIAGEGGSASAGDGGTVAIRYYDWSSYRYKIAVGHIGEGGLKPNVAYRVNNGKFEAVDGSHMAEPIKATEAATPAIVAKPKKAKKPAKKKAAKRPAKKATRKKAA